MYTTPHLVFKGDVRVKTTKQVGMRPRANKPLCELEAGINKPALWKHPATVKKLTQGSYAGKSHSAWGCSHKQGFMIFDMKGKLVESTDKPVYIQCHC